MMQIAAFLRQQSAFELLGQIEVWHLAAGKPMAEPRHPAIDTGESWPLIRNMDATHK
jgi:hypothetical protein